MNSRGRQIYTGLNIYRGCFGFTDWERERGKLWITTIFTETRTKRWNKIESITGLYLTSRSRQIYQYSTILRLLYKKMFSRTLCDEIYVPHLLRNNIFLIHRFILICTVRPFGDILYATISVLHIWIGARMEQLWTIWFEYIYYINYIHVNM